MAVYYDSINSSAKVMLRMLQAVELAVFQVLHEFL